MKIVYKTGNLLDAQTDVIAHQVNCQGVMGSGVAKQIREKWANVYTAYRAEYDLFTDLNKPLLGNCQLVQINDNQYVANLFGQNYYGKDDKRYTSYDAIYEALTSLRQQMTNDNLKSLAIPFHMSCDRGGADWKVLIAMLCSVFEETDISIEFWSINGYN
jgi:O-acetyl-ADP-ribose deacetylase (regulator of RNase III)